MNYELLALAKKAIKFDSADLGKKKFQKLVYMIENIGDVPLGYEYSIYFYGPYSRKLDDDLVELLHGGQIEYEKSGLSYLMRITAKGESQLKESAKELPNSRTIDDILERFIDKTPLDLELLTTTHYVYKSLHGSKDKNAIRDNVTRIKGRKFSRDRIDYAIAKLNLTA